MQKWSNATFTVFDPCNKYVEAKEYGTERKEIVERDERRKGVEWMTIGPTNERDEKRKEGRKSHERDKGKIERV
jgi:hypothetical protein